MPLLSQTYHVCFSFFFCVLPLSPHQQQCKLVVSSASGLYNKATKVKLARINPRVVEVFACNNYKLYVTCFCVCVYVCAHIGFTSFAFISKTTFICHQWSAPKGVLPYFFLMHLLPTNICAFFLLLLIIYLQDRCVDEYLKKYCKYITKNCVRMFTYVCVYSAGICREASDIFWKVKLKGLQNTRHKCRSFVCYLFICGLLNTHFFVFLCLVFEFASAG